MITRAESSPIGRIKARTIFEFTPFNFTYDGTFEAFSFYVPDDAVATVSKLQRNIPELKRWACTFVGREFDLERCESIGLRTVQKEEVEVEVEIRLKFGPPWYQRLANG